MIAFSLIRGDFLLGVSRGNFLELGESSAVLGKEIVLSEDGYRDNVNGENVDVYQAVFREFFNLFEH